VYTKIHSPDGDKKYITIEDVEKELRDGRRGVGGIGANGKMKSRDVILL
jgi:hypothetical protein